MRSSRRDLDDHVGECSFRPQVQQQQKAALKQDLEQRLARLETSWKKSNATHEDLLAACRDLLLAGDHLVALQWAERAQAKYPGLPSDETAADAFFLAGQWAKAQALFSKHAKLQQVANCQLKLGQYEEAERTLLQVLKAGSDVGSLTTLGALKKKIGAYADARRYLEDAMKLVSSGSKAWVEISLLLADCLRKTEQYEESKRLYIQVLKRAEVLHGKRSSEVGFMLIFVPSLHVDPLTQQYSSPSSLSSSYYYSSSSSSSFFFLLSSSSSPPPPHHHHHHCHHHQVAAVLNALGMLTKKLGQYPSAIKYYKAAIKLKCSLNNGDFNHAEIGQFLANLGDVFRKVALRKRLFFW